MSYFTKVKVSLFSKKCLNIWAENAMAYIDPKNYHLETVKKTLIIRSAVSDDAREIFQLKDRVIKELIFLLLEPEEEKLSFDEKRDYIKSHALNECAIFLVAEIENKIVGVLEFTGGWAKRIRHTGQFEILIDLPWRSHGIGKKLLETLFNWVECHPYIELISIKVHATNDKAIEFYKKNGFKIDGIVQRELKYGPHHYVDTVLMSKFLSEKINTEI